MKRLLRIVAFAILAVLALSVAILFDGGPSSKQPQAQGFSQQFDQR